MGANGEREGREANAKGAEKGRTAGFTAEEPEGTED